MEQIAEFKEFPKIPRFFRKVIISEKLDGTNAGIIISDDGLKILSAQSRNKLITPQDDNFGFANWVKKNETELLKLGPGHHFGEWWGAGVGRGYGLKEKRFSLFNTSRWNSENVPSCCHVVPVLWEGTAEESFAGIPIVLESLRTNGSVASPGFMKPEGLIAYHVAGNLFFKVTLEKDGEPKGKSSSV